MSPTGMTAINRKRKAEAGFTLIELTFVAVLFALFATLAAAQFRRSYESLSERSGLQDLLGLLTMARERAILERAPYGVHLVPATNQYWLVRGEPGAAAGDLTRVQGQWGTVHHLPSLLVYGGEETSVIFYADGTATKAELSFKNRDESLILSIDPVTAKGDIRDTSQG